MKKLITDTALNIQLISCPFCGERHKIHVRRQGNHAYRVICHSCGALGPYAKVEPWHSTKFIAQNQAKQLWNKRGIPNV